MLHWGIAALLLFQIPLGFLMKSTWLQMSTITRVWAFQTHKSIGILILILTFIRLEWRVTHRAPPMLPQMPDWEKRSTRANNIALYALVFAMCLSGWALIAYSYYATKFFGLFPIPDLPFIADTQVGEWIGREGFAEIHENIGTLLILSMLVHIGAMLWHHFYKRDPLMLRMIPIAGHPMMIRLREKYGRQRPAPPKK